jgi:hypothetical protein
MWQSDLERAVETIRRGDLGLESEHATHIVVGRIRQIVIRKMEKRSLRGKVIFIHQTDQDWVKGMMNPTAARNHEKRNVGEAFFTGYAHKSSEH